MKYTSVEIFRSTPESDINCKDLSKYGDTSKCIYKNVNRDTTFITVDPTSQSTNGFDKNATVDGLESGTPYGFFIRGNTQ